MLKYIKRKGRTEKVKLGNTSLRYGLCLAPMAGYSDRAMRLICHEQGAEYSVTEMVSAKAVVYNDKKTYSLAKICPDEGPVALQIFGSDPAVMGEAAAILSSTAEGAVPAAIDINMGCPVKKIFSNGEGSALMKKPTLIERIVRSVVASTPLPVTVKIRTGVDANSINAVECALAAEEAGACAICIHGRNSKQMYSGSVDRETIKNVKSALHIPLIANGDITNADDALTMISETGADGIAIGRGAVGNPFIFSEITAAIEKTTYTPPTIEQRAQAALRQLRIAVDQKGEIYAVTEARKQIALYLRSFRGAAKLRAQINTATTYAQAEEAVLRAISEDRQA